jgi:WD40-like Beta Propeller Repeat
MALVARLTRGARLLRALGLVCGALLSNGCDGEVVNLGSSSLQAGGAGAGGVTSGPRDVWTVQSQPLLPQTPGILLANPTLTAAMDELYYSQQARGADPDPHPSTVQRVVAIAAGWSASQEQLLGDSKMRDVSSPAISSDGQELWLGQNLSGSTDIFHSAREGDAWDTPQLVAELSDPDFDDVPRPPAVNGTIMPLSSKRHGGTPPLYQIYLSTRANSQAPWGEPSKALLATIDFDAFQSADGFLSDDGLELYFSSTRDGEHTDSDLYVARRATLDAPFGEPEALVDLNDPEGPSQERMPWLSPDRTRLYFVSDRTGQYTLYEATKR